MMLVPIIMTLSIASIATFLSLNSREEVVKVAMAFVAIFCAILALVFAPWVVKLIVMVIPFVLEKAYSWTQ